MQKYNDSYFLNSYLALEKALENNKLLINGVTKSTQICYYDGEKLENTPYNCINVPIKDIVEYFSNTPNRYPTTIEASQSSIKTQEELNQFKSILLQLFNISRQKQLEKIDLLKKQIKNQKPNFNDSALRVFIGGCRETTVMQYVSKNIVDSMRETGFEVKFHIQSSDLEACNLLQHLESMVRFNPHITININHLNNEYLSDGVFNFVWFQDAMPILTNDDSINLRDRDFIFSYSDLYTELLLKKNIPENKIFQQNLIPVDTKEFFLDKSIEKKDKVIFVGSFYPMSDFSQYMTKDIDSELKETINKGEVLSQEKITNIFKKYNINIENDSVYINLIQQGYSRNMVVSWLSDIDNKPVEIYGHRWKECNQNSILDKFKGSIEKTDLNALYNSAKYAISVSGQVINTQRLAEIVYSGAIPLIYDSRSISNENETWDDECLYFKTKDELKYILDNNIEPKKYRSEKMLEHFTYKNFIDTISKQINKELGK